MLFYIYDINSVKIKTRIKWDYDIFFHNRFVKEAYNAFLQHPNRTKNPEHADIFIVSFTLNCLSFVGFNIKEIRDKLLKLSYLNLKPHVVFDFTDLSKSIYDDINKTNLFICKSAFSKKYYKKNEDFHISIPQFPRYCFNNFNIPRNFKNKLLSFKGHPRNSTNIIRTKLFNMNDNKEIYTKTFSNNPDDFEFKIDNENMKMKIIPSNDENSYLNLLFNSRFSILPRGNGVALSYRHIESMNVGCIPVIISDQYILPFSEIIDWDSCSIRVKEYEVDNILRIVKNNIHREHVLKQNVSNIYNKYLSSTNQIINTLLYIIELKLKI
jgi:glucuronyl/N-acetylglucosaminyl transferase EXT1